MLNLKRTIAAAACAATLIAGTAAPAIAAENNMVEFENMNLFGQYVGRINNPFNGVAFYANNDGATFNQYFEYGTHDIVVKGCSTNDQIKNARVDMYIGGEHVADFYYGGTYPWECKVEGVNHKTGNQEIKFVVSTDNGQWDLKLDYVRFENARGAQGNQNGGQQHDDKDYYNVSPEAKNDRANQQNQQQQNQQPQQNAQPANNGQAETIVQCESMRLEGQFAHRINNPFNGVSLCGNGDAVVFNQYFANGVHAFYLRGNCTTDSCAEIDLLIGGVHVGSFHYQGNGVWECPVHNVTHKTGNQEVKLVVRNDNGTWDANIDYLKMV